MKKKISRGTRQRSPSTEEIICRVATVSDAPAVLRLIREYYAFDHLKFDGREIRTGLRILLQDASLGMVWLMLNKKRPAGYLMLTYAFDLEFGGRIAFITDFYLRPEHRRRGWGRKLLEQVEKFSRAQGVKSLELQVIDGNPAREFYRRCGFEGHARITMSKRLSF